MKSYSFLVKGGDGDYDVHFAREGSKFIATCTCKAGEMGMYCKHRFAIMNGCDTAIISPNIKQAKEIPVLLAGTDVEQALKHVRKSTGIAEAAEKELSESKKTLAKLMRPDSDIDRKPIDITYKSCGLVTALKLGWLKQNDHYVCACGASMTIKITYEQQSL